MIIHGITSGLIRKPNAGREDTQTHTIVKTDNTDRTVHNKTDMGATEDHLKNDTYCHIDSKGLKTHQQEAKQIRRIHKDMKCKRPRT